jgi:hypothetical protein
MSSQPNNQEQLLQTITTRAAVDNEFRSQLISDPRGAVAEAVGVQLPETFRIKFVEKEQGLDAMVVLPDYVPEAAELSEEELEAVAGGSEWVITIGCGILSGAAPV